MKIKLLLCCLACFLVFAPIVSFPQSRKSKIMKYETVPKKGKVILIDKSEIVGNVLFNDNEGIVTVQTDDGSRSFNSRKILSFEFFATDSTTRDIFYSLELTDPMTGLTDTEIFEVLKEFSSFAVLLRIERLKTGRSPVNSPFIRSEPILGSGLASQRDLQVFQNETIYFVSISGEFEPYIKMTTTEVDREFFDLIDSNRSQSKMINSRLFKKYTGQYFKSLTNYAKENKYSFKEKDDIIKILDEYERLISFESTYK